MGDQLLVGSCAGLVFSLDRHTGEEQWRFDTKPAGGEQFHGEMLVNDDRVIVGTDTNRGNAHAIDLETGSELWRYPCDVALQVDLQLYEGAVIGVARRDDDVDELFCLNLSDGAVVWTVDHDRLDGKAYANTPALIGNQVYFGSAGGVKVYDVRTGDLTESLDLGGPISTSLLHVDRHLYAGVGQELVRLNLDSGKVDARYDLGGKLVGKPALLDDGIGVLVNWRSPDSRLVVLDGALRTIRWQWRPQVNSNFGTIARLHTYRGDVIVATHRGHIMALDVETGDIQWQTSVEEAVRSAGFHDDIMYVGTIPGPVYAIRVPD